MIAAYGAHGAEWSRQIVPNNMSALSDDKFALCFSLLSQISLQFWDTKIVAFR